MKTNRAAVLKFKLMRIAPLVCLSVSAQTFPLVTAPAKLRLTGQHDSVGLIRVLYADFFQAFDENVAVGVVGESQNSAHELLA